MGAECLNQFLQRLLASYYSKLDGEIQLCICKREHGLEGFSNARETEWKCISGKEKSKKSLEQLLNRTTHDLTVDWDGKSLEDTNEYILYAEFRDSIPDSTLDGNGTPKDIIWVFLGKSMNDSVKLVLKILSSELIDKFEDMLFLDSKCLLEDGEQSDESNVKSYFMGNVLNKDWLSHQYVNLALKSLMLPEWRLFVQISALFYEKRTIRTKIYFADEEWRRENGDEISFLKGKTDTEIYRLTDSNLRTIRKLMELSGEDHGLLVRGKERNLYNIEGIIRSNKNSPTVYVEFLDHLVWQLVDGNNVIFKYRKGEYLLPALEGKDDFDDQLNKLGMLNLSDEQISKITEVIKLVKKTASHGSSVVFMDKSISKKEAERLSGHNKAYVIDGLNILSHKKEVKGMAAIDGAILADLDCECVALGCILDGKSIIPGDAGRGARYNSVVNYINVIQNEHKNICCFAVIISEDGMVNVVLPQ